MILRRAMLLLGLCTVCGFGWMRGRGCSVGELGGSVHTSTFRIYAHQTRLITSDFTVRATGDIQIDGELRIRPGAQVRLMAGRTVQIRGSISPLHRAFESTPVARQSEPFLLIGGRNIVIEGAIQAPNHIGFYCNADAPVEERTLKIHNVVQAANGVRAQTRSASGQEGCSIEIGTRRVCQQAREAGVSAVAPAELRIEKGKQAIAAGLFAGHGGDGFSDEGERTQRSKHLTLTGTSGGAGGHLHIFARRLFLTSVTLSAGMGGHGGHCGFESYPHAWDGLLPGEGGGNVFARCGSGGNGGDLILHGTILGTNYHLQSGVGGNAGAVGAVPGNGGPGGAGGSLRVITGLPGQRGHSNLPAVAAQSHSGCNTALIVCRGGNGGSAAQAHARGGPGGCLFVQGPGGGAPGVLPTSLLQHFGNGGAGFAGDLHPRGGLPGKINISFPGKCDASLQEGQIAQHISRSNRLASYRGGFSTASITSFLAR